MSTGFNLFREMNTLGASGIPFLFVISYDCTQGTVVPLDSAAHEGIFYNFEGSGNTPACIPVSAPLKLDYQPVPVNQYKKAFSYIVSEERAGNSYLANLTFPSKITSNYNLRQIYDHSRGRYKLCYKDIFTVFSPERFITIKHNIIETCPMKGTIPANEPDAEKKILADEKEAAEHITVVDLLRNDLNSVSHNVTVDDFRYIDRVHTARGDLLQVSSRITGHVSPNWASRIGSILLKLLPAGSVTGAPKTKTCDIIRKAECYDRGFYTGIAGIFDGTALNSAVLIRFIENTGNGLVYKSGGGITIYSDCKKEYAEMQDKIYVPI